MNWIAEQCVLAFGWRRSLIMVLAGAFAALSMPPLFALPTLFLALPMWIWALDGAEPGVGWRRWFGPAFSIGFSFGLGYFVVSLHWMGAAFFVDGGIMLAVMPLALLALAAAMALFWGLASAVAHAMWSHSASRVLALAITLTLAEFVRGHILTGFPFNLLGYALTANETMMQATALVGVYGLTFVAALGGFALAVVWPADDRALTTRLAPFFGMIFLIVLQLGYGQWRLDNTEITQRTDMRVRVVQPAIDQATKWAAGSEDFILERLMSLSQSQTGPNNTGLIGVTHLIWPEAALPFFLSDYPEALSRIARMLPPGTTLITGAPRHDPSAGTNAPDYNSIITINADGEFVATYDKTHLVPVGEYLPFRDMLANFGLQQFVPGLKGWTHGDARRLQSPPQTPPFLPLICYEAIFSGDMGAIVDEAQFMLNVTNDAWFDGSIGPAQHFHHARLRAVEHGLPMIRAANSGISAIIDPLGRITHQLAEGELGLFDAQIPNRLAPTLFSKYSHWPLLIALLFGGIILFFSRKRPHKIQ